MDEVVETALRCSLQIVDHEREQLRAQLAAVTAELAELRRRIAGAPVGWAVIRHDIVHEIGTQDHHKHRLHIARGEYGVEELSRVRLVIDDQETDHA